MDKLDYQTLRYSVVNQIADFDSGVIDSSALANSVMRLFLQAMASEQVRHQVSKRKLLTFRRSAECKPPSWAFCKSGISDRLPTL